MISLAIFVVFIALAVIGLYSAVRGQTVAIHQPQELLTRCHHVDLEAFRNLADPMQEQYLALVLPPATLHSLQRQRARVLLSYVESVAHNASLLISLGGNARLSPDADQRAAGQRLVNASLQMRKHAIFAMLKLRVALLLPVEKLGELQVPDDYSSLTSAASLLFRMQAPTAVSRIMAAL